MNYRLHNLTLLVTERTPTLEGENHRNAPPAPGQIYRHYMTDIGYRLNVGGKIKIIDLSKEAVWIVSGKNPDSNLPEITFIEPIFVQEKLQNLLKME